MHGIGALELGLFGAMYVFTIFGLSAGFHRHLAHRSFRTSKPMRWLLIVAASMGAQGPPLFWVATHRQHHALSDREGDPHSPHFERSRWRGFLYAHFFWMVRHPGGDITTYARDLLKDRLVFALNNQYLFWLAAGFVLPAIAGFAIGGTLSSALLGFLWGGLVRCFFVHHASWAVGSLCHIFGKRPYQTRDQSGNVWWLAPFSFGESHHNNHHAFPSSASHGLEWWEIDFTGWTIRLLEKLGLVWDVKIPSESARRLAKLRGYDGTELAMARERGELL